MKFDHLSSEAQEGLRQWAAWQHYDDLLFDDNAAAAERRRQRYIELHDALDQLMAAWALDQPCGKVFSNSTITELMQWSYRQTIQPDGIEERRKKP